ncbi:MAG: galactosyldiacylglycerol synthase [Rhizobacter sp.]|nr:galactosyldiacylglycerol synthase [Chlorobiales bacterium]
MIKLIDKDTGVALGEITEAHLNFMADLLEDDPEVEDYFISRETIQTLEGEGADKKLIEVLRKALGSREDMEISWSQA